MSGNNKIPRYAVRLILLLAFFALVFFGGLRLFVPEGSKLTGSYDAGSLRYIAAAPVSYAGPSSCGAAGCHAELYQKWSQGAHGARETQSKCEACHGPRGSHPDNPKKMPKVRGDGDGTALCLNCHRQLKARATTGQPQISPSEHPFPHKGVLACMQCHDPHSPSLRAPSSPPSIAPAAAKTARTRGALAPAAAEKCVACHGAGGRGGFAPVLAGQPIKMLKSKLIAFKTGTAKATMMNPIAAELTEKEIETLANYFAKQ